MKALKTYLLAAIAISGASILSLPARAAEEKANAMTGVLIDNACGDKKADEKAAASHTAACAKKEACAASGFQLIVGDKRYKFDDKGNEQAKAYFAKSDVTRVTVEGKTDGDKIEVASIKAADKDAEKK